MYNIDFILDYCNKNENFKSNNEFHYIFVIKSRIK
jgi:hypothetical protein